MDCCNTETYLSKGVVQKLKVVLYLVFFINAVMFLLELTSGIVAHSNALVADSLDMFGDALVYGLSLFVLSRDHKIQAKISLVKGLIMFLLGLYVFWEAFYKIIHPLVPPAQIITIIGIMALAANIASFLLLIKHKNKSINIKSAWVCSRNDAYGNLGVIGAGILVGYFNSMWPDIIVGLGIAGLVLYSSVGIIKESRKHII